MSSQQQSVQQPRRSALYPNAATDLEALGSPRRVTKNYSGFTEKAPYTPGIEDSPSAIKHYPSSFETPKRRTTTSFDVPPTTYAKNVTRERGSSFFAPEESPTSYKNPRMSTTTLQPTETTTQPRESESFSFGNDHNPDHSDQEGGDQPSKEGKGKDKEPPSKPPVGGKSEGGSGPGDGGGGSDDGSDDDDSGSDHNSNRPETGEEKASRMMMDAIAALQAIASRESGGGNIKMKEPDTFDGSNPLKLRPFLVSLTLHFSARPNSFKEEASKIMFALSYLRGVALQYFEPDILDPDFNNPPLWLTRYSSFVKELQKNFGPHNEVDNAEKKLVSLFMKHSDHLSDYLVKFNLYAGNVAWGDEALKYQFYEGLPDRLKDQFALHGKPDALLVMKDKAQDFDNRYWAREDEKKHDNRNRSHNTSSTPRTDNSSSSNKTQSSHNSSSSATSNKKPFVPKVTTTSSTPSFPSGHLNKEGKLSDAERKRRMDNKLCVICGEAGHFRNNCPKRKGPVTGKAASVSKDSSESSAPKK